MRPFVGSETLVFSQGRNRCSSPYASPRARPARDWHSSPSRQNQLTTESTFDWSPSYILTLGWWGTASAIYFPHWYLQRSIWALWRWTTVQGTGHRFALQRGYGVSAFVSCSPDLCPLHPRGTALTARTLLNYLQVQQPRDPSNHSYQTFTSTSPSSRSIYHTSHREATSTIPATPLLQPPHSRHATRTRLCEGLAQPQDF